MRLIVCSPIGCAAGACLAMDLRARLARNLIRTRHAKGWSQEELADEAGLHRTYVSGLERGVRNPTLLVLERLAKALKVTPGALLE